MRHRLDRLVLAATLAAALISPLSAFAQGSRWLEPPANAPRQQRGERTHNLDFLFEALKIAPTEESAKAIADRIWGIWLASGGDTANLLISRVRTAMGAKELDLAVQLLDSVIAFRPDYVEGWNQRATVYYMKKDYTRALADIAQVLSREPRHFGAVFGLGVIMQEFGDDKRALEVYRRALEIDPHMKRVPELVRALSEKVEGRDI